MRLIGSWLIGAKWYQSICGHPLSIFAEHSTLATTPSCNKSLAKTSQDNNWGPTRLATKPPIPKIPKGHRDSKAGKKHIETRIHHRNISKYIKIIFIIISYDPLTQKYWHPFWALPWGTFCVSSSTWASVMKAGFMRSSSCASFPRPGWNRPSSDRPWLGISMNF